MGSTPRQPRGQKPAWTPKDEKEAQMKAQGLPYVGIDSQVWQDRENEPDQAEQPLDSTPPSAPPAEVKKAAEAQAPDRDYDKLDSLGNPKMDHPIIGPEDAKVIDTSKLVPVEQAGTAGRVGPRGKEAPLDALTPEQKQARQAAQEKRLAAGMPSTARVDSVGNLKGNFADPKKRSEDTRLEEAEKMVGPRGVGAINADTFHGPRPLKKS